MEKEPVKTRNIFDLDITRMIILIHAMRISVEEQNADRVHIAFPDPRYMEKFE